MTAFGRMKSRRLAALLLVASSAVASLAFPAAAQNYPTKPVRFVVAQPPGGGTDTIGRAVAAGLSELWSQPTIVENKPGANTIVGAEYVARSPADGYTIWVAGDVGLTHNLFMYSKLPYDPRKDFALITRLLRIHSLLIVPSSLPANNLPEFVALMKKDGAKMNYGSPGIGDPSHIGMEWFKNQAGFDMVHVPYKGMAPALQGMLAGEIQSVIVSVLTGEQHIKTGKVKPIAISGNARSKTFPDVQTIPEQGYPNVSFSFWLALTAPAGTPPDIVKKIAADTRKVLYDPAFRAKYIDPYGYELLGDTPEEFAAFYKNDLIESEKKVKASGAKLD
jgi:tripartite-type tricarboxylate transporter receptor subunit TctC